MCFVLGKYQPTQNKTCFLMEKELKNSLKYGFAFRNYVQLCFVLQQNRKRWFCTFGKNTKIGLVFVLCTTVPYGGQNGVQSKIYILFKVLFNCWERPYFYTK